MKKEDAGARKGRKLTIHCVSLMICGSGGSKSRLAKAAGAEPCGRTRDEKLHTVAAAAAQSTLFKSTCTKHTMFGPPLEVEMSKSVLLRHKAHVEVKTYKANQRRSTLGR